MRFGVSLDASLTRIGDTAIPSPWVGYP